MKRIARFSFSDFQSFVYCSQISKTGDVKKLILLTIISILFSTAGAQNIYHPWIISAGANFTDFHVIKKPGVELFQDANWMGKKAPTMLRVGRLVTPCFSVSATWATLTLETGRLNTIPLDKHITDDAFFRAGLQAEYGFANGKLLKDESFFDPYFFSGFSASWLDDEFYPGIPAGVGIILWPAEYLGINFQASYEYLFDFNNYMHYALGITARFGNMIDKDRDRIADRYDACPEIWGLESMQGCPDYDHDGVADSLDKCPKEYGRPAADGCPDFDKDGIPDKEDGCPCEAGPKKFDGCPDPGSSVKEKPSEAPTETPQKIEETAAPIPVTPSVKDEMPSQEDEIVEADVPVVVPQPATINEVIDPHLDNIHFEANSAAIKPVSYPSLDKIHQIMRENPMEKFTIQGFTDNSGPTEYNLFLSEIRAKSIREYFTRKGIAPSRLDARGYGEIEEKYLNLTEEARAKNRRVEIYIKPFNN